MALLFTSLVAVAAPASASTVSMLRSGTGKAAFVQIAVDGINRGVVTGEFRWNLDPETPAGYDDTFYTYSRNARNALVNGATVAIRSTNLLTVAGVPNAGGKAAWLFNTYAPSVRGSTVAHDSRHQAAALQVAMWEAMLDSSRDVSSGTMKLSVDGDVRERARNYLHALYSPDGSYTSDDSTWLNLSTGEDQLALPGLPEPGTLLMFATGLSLSIIVVFRRRRVA